MKIKLFSIRQVIAGLTLICIGLGVFAKNVNAIAVVVDQRCRVTADLMGNMSVTNRTDLLQQTFKPTLNRLTKVSLYMEGDGVGSVTLWIVQDSESGTYYINSNGPVAEPNGKGMMEFYFDNSVMIPGENYIILPNPTDNSSLNWFYQEACYADGYGFMGQAIKSFDFAFQTTGYSVGQTPEQSDYFFIPTTISTPTPTSTVAPTVNPTKIVTPTTTPTATITSSPTGMGNKEMGVFVPTSSLTPVPVQDPEIQSPKVEYVLKNLEKIENLDEPIDVSEANGFVLYGTGEKDAKILVSLGEYNYEVVTGSNGEWFLQLPLSEIASGNYTITGQTQIDGKGGVIAELAKIRFQKDGAAGLVSEIANNKRNYYPYMAAILVILIGLTLLGMYLDARKKSMKTENTLPLPDSEKTEAVDSSSTTEEK